MRFSSNTKYVLSTRPFEILHQHPSKQFSVSVFNFDGYGMYFWLPKWRTFDHGSHGFDIVWLKIGYSQTNGKQLVHQLGCWHFSFPLSGVVSYSPLALLSPWEGDGERETHWFVNVCQRLSWYSNCLVVWNIFIFPYIGNNHPNWLSCFSEGGPTTNQQNVSPRKSLAPWSLP